MKLPKPDERCDWEDAELPLNFATRLFTDIKNWGFSITLYYHAIPQFLQRNAPWINVSNSLWTDMDSPNLSIAAFNSSLRVAIHFGETSRGVVITKEHFELTSTLHQMNVMAAHPTSEASQRTCKSILLDASSVVQVRHRGI